MFSAVVSRLIMLVFGTLYPAYASYKAVRTKNVKEYVKWMMYWIVFALFSCLETFTDVFLCWFPFYYELKIVIVLWLLSPATKGSSILYRKFVHPMLSRREQEIDEYISKAKEQGYSTVVTLGAKGVNYATSVIMQTAIKGGGGLVNQLKKSYSLSDLTNDKDSDRNMETDGFDTNDRGVLITDSHMIRSSRSRGYSPKRSASTPSHQHHNNGNHNMNNNNNNSNNNNNNRMEMVFPAIDVNLVHSSNEPSNSLQIRSSEDITLGYGDVPNSNMEHLIRRDVGGLVRTSSVGGSRSRTRTTRSSTSSSTTKRLSTTSENDLQLQMLADLEKETVTIPNNVLIYLLQQAQLVSNDNVIMVDINSREMKDDSDEESDFDDALEIAPMSSNPNIIITSPNDDSTSSIPLTVETFDSQSLTESQSKFKKKRNAPPPPSQTIANDKVLKASLTLKQGFLSRVSKSGKDEKIHFVPSPKMQRKATKKGNDGFKRLLHFPKKITFWNSEKSPSTSQSLNNIDRLECPKPKKSIIKRLSWHADRDVEIKSTPIVSQDEIEAPEK